MHTLTHFAVPIHKREGPLASMFQFENKQADTDLNSLIETPIHMFGALAPFPGWELDYPSAPDEDYFNKGFEKDHGLHDKEGVGLDID